MTCAYADVLIASTQELHQPYIDVFTNQVNRSGVTKLPHERRVGCLHSIIWFKRLEDISVLNSKCLLSILFHVVVLLELLSFLFAIDAFKTSTRIVTSM